MIQMRSHLFTKNRRRIQKNLASAIFALLLLMSAPALAQQGQWAVVDSVFNMFYFGVACADSLNCVVTGNNGNEQTVIRRSTDAGLTWKTIFLDTINLHTFRFPPKIQGIAYPTPNLCIGVTDSGTVVRTTDAGASWSVTQVDSFPLEDIFMFDEHVGVLVASSFRLLRTTDGGATWAQTNFRMAIPKRAVAHACMPDSHTIIALTGFDMAEGPTQLIARSDDFGETWEVIRPPFDVNAILHYLHFTDTNRGWVVGANGDMVGLQHDLIYATTDGGRTWQLQLDTLNPIAYGLDQIAFVDNLHGIACGQTPKILRTSDGGITWKRDTVPMGYISPISVHAIAYPSPAYALAVTTQGQILRYAEMPAAVHEPNISETTRDLLYPNPISPGATLTIPGTESANEISIVDPLGRVVRDGIRPEPDEHGVRLLIRLDAEIPPGIYFMHIREEHSSCTFPLVVR